MNRIEKEKKTLGVMIRIFCGAHHSPGSKLLCPVCTELLEYAEERLNKCPYGENKGACSKCQIHCYRPDMRKHITEVMRYSGPNMVRKYPLLAIDHLLRIKSPKQRKTTSGKPDKI
jgi:hypothetical protein